MQPDQYEGQLAVAELSGADQDVQDVALHAPGGSKKDSYQASFDGVKSKQHLDQDDFLQHSARTLQRTPSTTPRGRTNGMPPQALEKELRQLRAERDKLSQRLMDTERHRDTALKAIDTHKRAAQAAQSKLSHVLEDNQTHKAALKVKEEEVQTAHKKMLQLQKEFDQVRKATSSAGLRNSIPEVHLQGCISPHRARPSTPPRLSPRLQNLQQSSISPVRLSPRLQGSQGVSASPHRASSSIPAIVTCYGSQQQCNTQQQQAQAPCMLAGAPFPVRVSEDNPFDIGLAAERNTIMRFQDLAPWIPPHVIQLLEGKMHALRIRHSCYHQLNKLVYKRQQVTHWLQQATASKSKDSSNSCNDTALQPATSKNTATTGQGTAMILQLNVGITNVMNMLEHSTNAVEQLCEQFVALNVEELRDALNVVIEALAIREVQSSTASQTQVKPSDSNLPETGHRMSSCTQDKSTNTAADQSTSAPATLQPISLLRQSSNQQDPTSYCESPNIHNNPTYGDSIPVLTPHSMEPATEIHPVVTSLDMTQQQQPVSAQAPMPKGCESTVQRPAAPHELQINLVHCQAMETITSPTLPQPRLRTSVVSVTNGYDVSSSAEEALQAYMLQPPAATSHRITSHSSAGSWASQSEGFGSSSCPDVLINNGQTDVLPGGAVNAVINDMPLITGFESNSLHPGNQDDKWCSPRANAVDAVAFDSPVQGYIASIAATSGSPLSIDTSLVREQLDTIAETVDQPRASRLPTSPCSSKRQSQTGLPTAPMTTRGTHRPASNSNIPSVGGNSQRSRSLSGGGANTSSQRTIASARPLTPPPRSAAKAPSRSNSTKPFLSPGTNQTGAETSRGGYVTNSIRTGRETTTSSTSSKPIVLRPLSPHARPLAGNIAAVNSLQPPLTSRGGGEKTPSQSSAVRRSSSPLPWRGCLSPSIPSGKRTARQTGPYRNP